MAKFNIFKILNDYIEAVLEEARNFGNNPMWDIVIQLIIPLAAAVFASLFKIVITDVNAIVTGVSIVSALMGAMAVLIFQIRLQLRITIEEKDESSQSLNSVFSSVEACSEADFKLVDILFRSTMWTIVVGLILSFVLIVYSAFNLASIMLVPSIVTLISIFLGTHFVIMLGACVVRLSAAYQILISQENLTPFTK